jgi:O-antigen/teichoic acid export membrane protein
MKNSFSRLLPDFIKAKLEGRTGLQKVIGNTGWLAGDKALRMGVGLLINIWVVRYLGPAQFGLLSYSTAFVALFSAFATLGLDGIVVRELVKSPADYREILGSALTMRALGGVMTLFVSVVAISLLRKGELLTLWMVAIIATGAVFQSTDVVDFWFQSQVLSKYTVVAKNCAFLVSALVKGCLILFHAPLLLFAGAVLLEVILGAGGLVIAYRKSGGQIGSWKRSVDRCRRLLTDSWPLILSGFSIAVYMKIDQVMLGDMAGDKVVGIYSSAVRLSEIWYFVPMIIVSSVFPAVIQAKATDEGLYYRRIQRLFSLMAALSLSIAVPMTFASTWVVVLLFGKGFAAAGPVLAIHIWASLFVFFGVAQSPWDLTENLTRLALFRIATGALLNIILNLVLIPPYGAMGTAIATVISQAFAAVILNAVHWKTRRILVLQMKAFFFFRYLREL